MRSIKKCDYGDIESLKYPAKKENVTLTRFAGATYFSALVNDMVVGCACMFHKKKTVRLYGDFVLKEFRNKGIFDELFCLRMEHIKGLGFSRITSFVTSGSFNTYKRNGFYILSQKYIRYGSGDMKIRFLERVAND